MSGLFVEKGQQSGRSQSVILHVPRLPLGSDHGFSEERLNWELHGSRPEPLGLSFLIEYDAKMANE